MVCKMCGTELADGVKFCSACGGAVETVEETAPVLTDVATEQEEVKSVGEAQEEIATASAVAQPLAAPVVRSSSNNLSLCEKIGRWCLLGGAFFSLIFVWFIGVEVGVGGYGSSAKIYRFFGKAWKSLDDVSTATWFGGMEKAQQIFFNLLGLATSIFLLVSVAYFGIKAGVQFTLSIVRKEEDVSEKAARRCIYSFLGGSLLFLVLVSVNVNIYGMDVGTAPHGTTTAGIILGCLALVASTVSKLLPDFRVFLSDKEKLMKLVFAGGALLIVCALLGFAKNSVMKYTYNVSGVSMGLSSNALEFANFVTQIAGSAFVSSSVSGYAKVKSLTLTANIFSFLSQILSVAFVLLTIYALIVHIRRVEGEEKSYLKLAIIIAAVAVGSLICNIVACSFGKEVFQRVEKTLGESVSLKGNYGTAICTVIFAAVLVAIEFVRDRFFGTPSAQKTAAPAVKSAEVAAEVAVADSEATPTESAVPVENSVQTEE